jgi:hypothetical protein
MAQSSEAPNTESATKTPVSRFALELVVQLHEPMTPKGPSGTVAITNLAWAIPRPACDRPTSL